MAIDWETGKITDEQHVLHPEQLTPMVKCLEVGDITYIEVDSLRADKSGALWLDPESDTYFDEEADDVKDDLYLCRIIKTGEGFIVDASTGDFRLDFSESQDTIPVHTVLGRGESDWLPVVGVVGSDLERAAIGKILFNEHDIVLGRSVLMPPLETSSEDGSGQDDGIAA